MRNNPSKIITHTAASAINHTVLDVDRWHKQRWPGFVSREGWHVGYHYVIEWDGGVTQTREHDEEGAHCIGQNTTSIGVCFMGNGDVHEPSDAQKKAWIHLYAKIHAAYPNITTTDIYPHRKWANKSCHGKLLSDTYYVDLLTRDSRKTALQAQIVALQATVNRLYSLLRQRRMK